MTKVISLSDAAYEQMKQMKDSDESFSDVVLRLIKETHKKSLMDFVGRWPISSKEAEKIKKPLR